MLSLAKKADWRLLFGDETLKQSYSFWFLMNEEPAGKRKGFVESANPFLSCR